MWDQNSPGNGFKASLSKIKIHKEMLRRSQFSFEDFVKKCPYGSFSMGKKK